MNPFEYIKNLEHHVYFIQSFKDSADYLKSHLKDKFDISHLQNPDFYHEKFEVLGIDDSRKIKENHLSKGFKENGRRIFIIEASGITHEAQNSLLKILEEPNSNSHFFIIMPTSEILLPTLRSRLYIINSFENKHNPEILNEVNKFLKLSKKEKVTFVDEIAKNISDEKINKIYAIEFLSALESTLYKRDHLKNTKILGAIIKARDYMNDRSPSVKQLLEYIALIS